MAHIKNRQEEAMALLDQLRISIVNGDPDEAKDATRKALQDGLKVEKILNEGLVAGIHEVGEKFGRNEIFLPELLVSGLAMRGAVGVLKPFLSDPGVKTAGKAVIATVRGDLHDIGKNLVAMMLEGGGFEVIDLGIDIAAEKIVEAAQEQKVQLVCLSSLLTTTMPAMREVVQGLQKAGLNQKVKVMIGGAPVTQKYADEIGADGYAEDAPSAVKKAKELMAGAS
jgi:5-methyltetrahydrofolate--homocysteine methyltransferase